MECSLSFCSLRSQKQYAFSCISIFYKIILASQQRRRQRIKIQLEKFILLTSTFFTNQSSYMSKRKDKVEKSERYNNTNFNHYYFLMCNKLNIVLTSYIKQLYRNTVYNPSMRLSGAIICCFSIFYTPLNQS